MFPVLQANRASFGTTRRGYTIRQTQLPQIISFTRSRTNFIIVDDSVNPESYIYSRTECNSK